MKARALAMLPNQAARHCQGDGTCPPPAQSIFQRRTPYDVAYQIRQRINEEEVERRMREASPVAQGSCQLGQGQRMAWGGMGGERRATKCVNADADLLSK
jgi:hypothetical protein